MKYVLYGAGLIGKMFYDHLKNKYDIVCFADRSQEKQGQMYLGLDVIPPEKIIETGLTVIISVGWNLQFEIMRYLFEMGIKEFYIINNYDTKELLYIDFRQYSNINEQKNKICVLKNDHSATADKCFTEGNPFDDLIVVSINSKIRDNDFFYHYLTCSLVITQFMNMPQLKGKRRIEMWHGLTIKTLGEMSRDKRDWRILSSEKSNNIDAFCTTSKLYEIIFGYSFNIPYEKFRITGYPRNDALFTADGRGCLEAIYGKIKQKNIVIYLPTFRENTEVFKELRLNGANEFIFDMPGFNITEFNRFLENNDILFLAKMHSWQIKQTGESLAESFKNSGNIKLLTDEMLNEHNIVLNEILNGTNCLISEYSSVIIDYLLLDKPIILTPTDLEAYEESRGLVFEPYGAWMPGEIALDSEQLKTAIVNAVFGEDTYKKDRERFKRIAHKYEDANSVRRLLEVARELLGL